MNKMIFSVALAAATTVAAQTPAIAISSGTVAAVGRAAVPVLGYLPGSEPLELRAIVGTAKSATLGEVLTMPGDNKRLFLPPRQQYVLLEARSAQPPAVWTAQKQEALPIEGALAHPDLVVFSPRGDAALLYSRANDRLQIVSGLPAQPAVTKELAIGGLGDVADLAVSDDGGLVVASFADGSVMFSSSGRWEHLAAGYTPRAWSFVPQTHDLIISDTAQEAIVLLPDVGRSFGTPRILAQGLRVDNLALTKDGEQLLAAGTAEGKVWTIDLKTAAVAASSVKVDALLSLRDGHTFLLSTSPDLSLVRLVSGTESSSGSYSVNR